MAQAKPDTQCVEPAKGPLVSTEIPSPTPNIQPKEERKMIGPCWKTGTGL